MSHEAVFTRIYRGSEWLSDESRSGPGSELVRTAGLRRELPERSGSSASRFCSTPAAATSAG